MKNDLVKEQNIDFDETPLSENILNLVEVLQGINSIRMLLVKSKSKSNLVEEQSIDFGETLLFKNVLSLVEVL